MILCMGVATELPTVDGGSTLWVRRTDVPLPIQRLLTATGARLGLLQPDGITTADLATLQHGGIDSNVSPIVLGCCAQDTCILREITLRKRRHHAAGAGTGDAQANGIVDREHSPDPSILHEIILAGHG